eukprot:GABV01003967.1.p1 GENE.GABV01003967.1~~GABV01003967.1.p1  ORF type:complete len:120 (-),score=6.99 GABV01003967.1:2-361(-)
MEYITSEIDSFKEKWRMFRKMGVRKVLHQLLGLAMILCSALMIWNGLKVLTHCESPIVVVLSGSMETCIYRGDILFLHNDHTKPFEVGEIVVYKIKERTFQSFIESSKFATTQHEENCF